MIYKHHTITRSGSTTASEGNRPRPLYMIEGKFKKRADERPFLTSLDDCREWINNALYAAWRAEQGSGR